MIFHQDWSYIDEDCPLWIRREKDERVRERREKFYRRCLDCSSCIGGYNHSRCDEGDYNMVPIWQVFECPKGRTL